MTCYSFTFFLSNWFFRIYLIIILVNKPGFLFWVYQKQWETWDGKKVETCCDRDQRFIGARGLKGTVSLLSDACEGEQHDGYSVSRGEEANKGWIIELLQRTRRQCLCFRGMSNGSRSHISDNKRIICWPRYFFFSIWRLCCRAC